MMRIPKLSPRQEQIAALVAQGKSNKEIALELKLTYSTIDSHMCSIFRKLGCVNRTVLALWAVQRRGEMT